MHYDYDRFGEVKPMYERQLPTEIICLGKAGQYFASYIGNNPERCKGCNVLILDNLESKIANRASVGSLAGSKRFCVFGASSSKNVSKVISYFDHWPAIWKLTHFVLIHPFNFEGNDRIKNAKETSDFIVRQGATVTDLYNQDLFQYVDKNAKFETGFLIMNGWIEKVIEEHRDVIA